MSNKSLTPFEKFSEYQSEHSLAHELPYWDVLENVVVLKDGTLVRGYRLKGIAIEALDTDRLNQITVDCRALLNGLPDGYEFSFVVDVNSDFTSTINAHQEKVKGHPVLGVVSDARIESLRQEVKENLLLKSNLILFIYKRYLPSDTKKALSYFSSPKLFSQKKKEEHEKLVNELRQTCDGVQAGLEALAIHAEPISGENVWEQIYRFVNPNRSAYGPAPHHNTEHRNLEFSREELSKAPELALSSPSSQLVFSDVIMGYESFYCDGLYHRTVTLKTLPEFTHSALVSRLMTLGFPHVLHVHIRVPEQSKELSSLQAKRRMAHSMSLSHEGRATDLESEARLNSTEDLLREIINTGQKIFYFQVALLLRAETKDDLDIQTRAVLAKVRELNGAEAMAETVAGFKVWKTLLPFGTLLPVRAKRVKTDNLADFLPLYQPYEGMKDAEPICLFRNREAGLVRFNPFDSRLPNYNTLVTGSSGAGKSFLNNLVLLQYMTQKPLVYIIDIGGSYKKLCEFMGGQYIEISPPKDDGFCKPINPFLLPHGETEPSPQKIKFLLAFLENVLTDEDGQKLHKLDKSLLEEAVVKTYLVAQKEGKSSPTISTLYRVLSESKEDSLKNFSRMLYPWTGNRPYGRLLDAENKLDLTSDFVVFDLKGLSSYPDLQSAMILIITDFILGQIDGRRDRRKQILMDECWELLKSKGSAHFMEYCVRTLRKTGSGITFITQGLEEIIASPIGPAILSNTATKFILLQRGDLEPIRKILKLNDQEMSLISSLRSQKGRFSESFMVNNEDRAVIRIAPTPLEYWLATSDAQDNDLIEKRRKIEPEKSLEEHLCALSLEFPFGVSGGRK